MMKKSALTVLTGIALFGFSAVQVAQADGNPHPEWGNVSSPNNGLKIGYAEKTQHGPITQPAGPGVAVPFKGGDAWVSLRSFFTNPNKIAPPDANNVVSYGHKTPGVGGFSFSYDGKTEAGKDVYFGEWKKGDQGNVAFVLGEKPSTNISSSEANVTYATRGINNYDSNGKNVLTGTLTANFSDQTLAGSIGNAGVTNGVKTLTLNGVKIDKAAGTFVGGANAVGSSGDFNGIAGQASGHFYNGIEQLGGVASFGNDKANTAFAGHKSN